MGYIATFTVTMTAPATGATVDYTTVNGTGVAGTDYTATSGTLMFGDSLSQTITVPVFPTSGNAGKTFQVVLSNPVGCTLTDSVGDCTISTGALLTGPYADRFNWTYDTMKNTATGFFGPPSGPKAFQIPYHAVEKLIVEAPDWGHESVSETISFWAKLEAWKLCVSGDATGYAAAWNSIESNFIPSSTNQPLGDYNPGSPATYQPEADDPLQYPTAPDPTVVAGADPLYSQLQATYGSKTMYLMHWMWDTDGVYGFKNGDGTTQQVAINSYQRGMQEGVWETVTQPEWEDFTQGGNAHGFLPIFNQGKPDYPSAPFDYGKQWRYTSAPDAEVRTIGAAILAKNFAATAGKNVATQDAKAKKMGDYLRYALYDKYYRPVGVAAGQNYDGSGAHQLISWYVAWGGEIPASGQQGSWGFRIGSSEIHFGYNGVDAAYAMATSGEGYSPTTSGAANQWQTSLQRQLEMIRWLQSPEGPIAGGVSNSWKGRYETPTDGRQNAKFYGMYYTYSPVWHDPPSNNWFGFQAWGLERVAALYLRVSNKTGSFNTDIRTKCGVILDRFVPWVIAHADTTTDPTTFSLPVNLWWVSTTEVPGQTTSAPNNEGVYEYIPSLNWDWSGDYAAFWNASSVPNPNLHCIVSGDPLRPGTPANGLDLGSASSVSQLLIEYAKAKLNAGGTLNDAIPGSSYHVQDALNLAKIILDRIWAKYKDTKGFTHNETRTDYQHYNDKVWVPNIFTGHMPNGDPIGPGLATSFIDMRSFMKNDPEWQKVQTYINSNFDPGSVPTFQYHRFWHTTEIAVGFAMMAKYFPDQVPA
jgi:hypothetical protein